MIPTRRSSDLTKLEVRFSKENELVQVIEQTIQEKLRQLTLIPSMTYENKAKNKVEQHSFEFDHNMEEKPSNNAKQNKNIESHTNQYENSTKIVQKINESNIVTKKPKNEASQ